MRAMWVVVLLLLTSCSASPTPELREQHVAYLTENRWQIINQPDGTKVENGDCVYITKTIHLYHPDAGTLFHEVGHAILHQNWYSSLYDNLYSLEGHGNSVEEYMANAFEEMYTHPDVLSKTSPETYRILREGFFGEFAVNNDFLREEAVK